MLVTPTPGIASAATCEAWTGVQPPSPSNFENELNSVAVLSPCNAWAVGLHFSAGEIRQTLIEHWNGSSWTVVPSPSPGTTGSQLFSVSAVSASNAWAVGSVNDSSSSHGLIEHWDGLAWTVVPTPDLGANSDDSVLNGVSAVSASDAWAVGSTGGPNDSRNLALHWNGRKWATVLSPSFGSADELNAVTAVSASDAWAVGDFHASSGRRTLILHWNGHSWAKKASPNPGVGTNNELFAVSATSRTDAWAVGRFLDGDQTMVLHWNGRRWVRMNSPSPGGSGHSNELFGVAAASASNAWAVGDFFGGSGFHPLILHWDGRKWAKVDSLNQASSVFLEGVAATSARNVWAVGANSDGVAFAIHCC